MTDQVSRPEGEPGRDQPAAEPAAPPSKPTPKKRRWRRIAILLLLAVVLVTIFLPTLAAPFLREKVEAALSEQLGVDGRIGRLSLSWFSGVGLRDVDFPAPGQEIRFHELSSDVTVNDLLFGGDTLHLGDSLDVKGLRLRLDLREDAKTEAETDGSEKPNEGGSGAESGEPLRLRIPAINLAKADVEITTDAGTLTLVADRVVVRRPTTLAFGEGVPRFTDYTMLDLRPPSGVPLHQWPPKIHSGPPLRAADAPPAGPVCVHFRWQPASTSQHTTPWSGNAEPMTLYISPASDGTSVSFNFVQGGLTLVPSLEEPVSEEGASRWIRIKGHTNLTLGAIPYDVLNGFAEEPPSRLVAEYVAELKHCVLSAQWDDTSVRDVEVRATGDRDRCKISFEGAMNDGTLKGDGTLTASNWNATLVANDVQTSGQVIDALARVSPFFVLVKHAPTQPRCLIGLNTSLVGRFDDDPLETVTGDGHLTTSAGDLQIKKGWEALIELIDRKNKGDTVLFEPFEQPFQVTNGKILNQGFELSTKQGSLLVEGHTTLSGNLHHDLRLDRVLAKELGDKADRTEYKVLAGALESQVVRLRGSVSEPDLQLPDVLQNPGNLIQEILKPGGAGSKAIEKGLDDLIEKGLDDLFGGRKKKRKRDN